MRGLITDSTAGSIASGRGGLDDRAASPIIGVILMLAITVIVASVVAVFVFGFGVDEPGPSVTFEYGYDEDGERLLVHHVGGDTFQSDRVTFSWDDNEATWTDMIVYLNVEVTVGDGGWLGDSDPADGEPDSWAIEPDDTVTVSWESEDGEQSTVLDTWEGPDA
ncbi:type IV pilin [Halapricum salinum]|uniref:Type IV pilin n=1 Tax=Halapricum salinum TaxID=1457250 RepID=A0A4D6HEI6_9EURY|nr:type IV pilin N-terminal domain-containing protein [Halapricum salinum]QCC51578.1 type IV pilin [Halapricum salinum]